MRREGLVATSQLARHEVAESLESFLTKRTQDRITVANVNGVIKLFDTKLNGWHVLFPGTPLHGQLGQMFAG